MATEVTVVAALPYGSADVWWALSTAKGLRCWQGESVRPMPTCQAASGAARRGGFQLEWPSLGATTRLEVGTVQAPNFIEYHMAGERTQLHVSKREVRVSHRGPSALLDRAGVTASWRRALLQLVFALRWQRPQTHSYYRALHVPTTATQLETELVESNPALAGLLALVACDGAAELERFAVPGRELWLASPGFRSLVTLRSLPAPGGTGSFVSLGWVGYRGEDCPSPPLVDASAEALARCCGGHLLDCSS